MMEIYPYGGFWAYLKYNFLDGLVKQNLLLFDKTRYNYDKDNEGKAKHTGKVKSAEEVTNLLANFSFKSEKPKKD